MDCVSVLEEHETSPGLLLALLGYDAMRRLRAAHDAHDLKPRQFQILGLLERGGLGQRELGERMGLDPSIVVGLLNPLEDRRLRQPATATRPIAAATPSASRRRAPSTSRPPADAQRAVEDELFAALSTDQREHLRSLAARAQAIPAGLHLRSGPGAYARARPAAESSVSAAARRPSSWPSSWSSCSMLTAMSASTRSIACRNSLQ